MAWRIEFLPDAEKELKKLGSLAARRILSFLAERVRPLNDPRALGEPLRGPELGKYWKYRLGDYRLVCRIREAEAAILIVRVGHRKDVYRKREA